MCDDLPEPADRTFELVRKLSLEGKYQQCLDELRCMDKMYKDVSEEMDLSFWRGRCLLGLGKYNEAIDNLEAAMSLGRSNPDSFEYTQILRFLCHAYYSSNEWSKAADVCDQLSKYLHHYGEGEEGALGEFHQLRGLIYTRLGEYGSAIESLGRALKILPDSGATPSIEANLLHDIADAYYGNGKYQKAYEVFQKINLDYLSDDRIASYRYRNCLLAIELENYKELLEHAEALIALNNRDLMAAAYSFAGGAHFYMGNGPESVTCFKKSGEYPMTRDWIQVSNEAFMEKLKGHGFE